MSLTKKILIGMSLGIIAGLLFNLAIPGFFDSASNYVLIPLGKIFINLIKMLVVPIVIVSLILGSAGISDPRKLGRIGGKTIAFFLVTTAIAIILALAIGMLFQPGAGDFQLEGAEYEEKEAPPVIETLLNIIPTNPFNAMVQESMLQIIVFSIFIGFGLARLGDKVQGIVRLVEQANEVLMYLVNVIMKFAPYGAFALIATAIGGQGLDAVIAMGKYMFVVLFVLLLHLIIVYGSALSFLGKMNPIKFLKGFSPAMVVAFSTSSSSATLPISMKAAQNNLGVSKTVSSFVQPLGATINMDGTAIMQGVATIFIAQVYGQNLSMSQLLTVVLTATLASVGTAGVPGAGIIMLSMVLTSVNLPVEAIALVLGVDRLIDMCRTSINITGDAVCAVIISRSEDTIKTGDSEIVNV
ncbi:dicarboxylate/amino acid:cation symporter [Bacillus sp. FJAT-49705]|uniref:Dicarboxylate/amino acid:cation symporter n=1 Tax=Cytobacillus citreus TaxID=2833586 RepID=A0ABS5NPD7_9BACI|nr:dicarboxylate/amino acid:cation symporter [Cytobacillus citreus]MBS4189702.1 dicarboxylate/amino acid:cation symporter [Cytobacillus citreus]